MNLEKKIVFAMLFVVILFIGFNISFFESQATTADNVITGANDFLKAGNKTVIQETELKQTSDFIFYFLLAIAIIVAVIIGMIIGIQFMMAGVEEKAKLKEALMPYFFGCVVVFGAFGIWKLSVTILSKL